MAKRGIPSTSYDLFSALDHDDDYLEGEEEEEVDPPPKCTHNTHTKPALPYPSDVRLSKKLPSKKETVSKPRMYTSP